MVFGDALGSEPVPNGACLLQEGNDALKASRERFLIGRLARSDKISSGAESL